MGSLTQTHFIRPRVQKRAKYTECKCSSNDNTPRTDKKGKLTPKIAKDITNPIKKTIMKLFKIEEIDYDKFRKESMWAIRMKEKGDKVKK